MKTKPVVLNLRQLAESITSFTSTPLADAKVLAAEVLSINIEHLNSVQNYSLSSKQNSYLLSLIAKLRKGMPVQLVVKWVFFHNLRIELPCKVLIPRSETERLVDLGRDYINRMSQKSIRVLEVGAGSGCITCSLCSDLLGTNKQILYTSVDIAKSAIANIEHNLATLDNFVKSASHQFSTRSGTVQVSTLRSSLLNFTKRLSQPVDLIIANPPYLTTEQYSKLATAVGSYEPKIALLGGPDGLKYYRQLVQLVQKLVNLQGFSPAIILEIDPVIATEAYNLFKPFYAEGKLKLEEDSYGNLRYLYSI